MTTEFISDCCDCIIWFDQNVRFVKAVQVCQIHKTLNGQDLLNRVLSHNQQWKFTTETPTPIEIHAKRIERRAEKNRIHSMGDAEIR